MSKISSALEREVEKLRIYRSSGDERITTRMRRDYDRIFLNVMGLLSSRIRHFTRQYGLIAHAEDARQVCSIAVHRAINDYNPEKASFTTFVNWMIRGELQGLRFRLMADQRPSARKVNAITLPLAALVRSDDEDGGIAEFVIEDEDAQRRTEANASAYLAQAATRRLLDGYVEHLKTVGASQQGRRRHARGTAADRSDSGKSVVGNTAGLLHHCERNRDLVAQRLFDIPPSGIATTDGEITSERVRQIAKRAVKTMSMIAQSDPRFAIMHDGMDMTLASGAPAVMPATSRRTPPRPPRPAPDRPSRTLH